VKNLLIPRILQKILIIQINVANLSKKSRDKIIRFDYILFLITLESG
jgi:hypothetical protein